MLFCFIAVLIGATKLPPDLSWKHIFGAGLLAGIGFTMSIFITNLAFYNQAGLINTSKLAILFGSLCAGGLGYVWLSLTGQAISKDNFG
jgi:NhaA family Na+:H+ antiporter